MRTNALTKTFFLALALAFSGAAFTTTFAGSADYSKDKAIVAPAPVCDPRWYISIGGGFDFDYGATDFVNGVDAQVFPPDDFYVEHLRSHTYNDVYDNSIYRIQGEVGYVLNPHMELFGLFKYAGGYGYRQYGDVDIEFDTQYPLYIDFGDYRSWGGELGFRYFFLGENAPWHVRPYVSISGGATYVENISVNGYYDYNTTASSDWAPFVTGNVYDESLVGTGALLLGIEVPINCHWSFGLEGGVRYESQLDASGDITQFSYYEDPSTPDRFTVPDLAKYNEGAGDRLYFPATAYLKYRF